MKCPVYKRGTLGVGLIKIFRIIYTFLQVKPFKYCKHFLVIVLNAVPYTKIVGKFASNFGGFKSLKKMF